MVNSLNALEETVYACLRLQVVLHITKHLEGQLFILRLEVMQLAEIASINNRVFRTVGSHLVLPNHHSCLLKPVKGPDFMVTVDHLQLLHKDVQSIMYRVADEKIRFARFRAFPFWQRVHDSFIDSDLEV